MSQPTYEVIKRYREKALKRITVDLPKELAEQWEAKLYEDGLTKAGFIKRAITEYLNKKPE